jgi:hypothetical protein
MERRDHFSDLGWPSSAIFDKTNFWIDETTKIIESIYEFAIRAQPPVSSL